MRKIIFTFATLTLFANIFGQGNTVSVIGEIVSFIDDNRTHTTLVTYVDSIDELSSYYIKPIGKGKELKTMNGSNVQITGVAQEDNNGNFWLTVTSWLVSNITGEEEYPGTPDDTLSEDALKNAWDD